MENTQKRGKFEIRWNNGRIIIRIDISWKLAAVLLAASMPTYAPQVAEALRAALAG